MHWVSCLRPPADLLTLLVLGAMLLDCAACDGAPGSEARDFACVIYDAAFLNCSWAAGPCAPPDVQYFLFIASHRDRKKELECPRYSTAAGSGLHIGCHLRDLSALGALNYFRVNGTSAQTRVRELVAGLRAKRIERFQPPGNVSVTCNASLCCVTWLQPRTWVPLGFRDFRYQVLVVPESSQNTEDLSSVVNVESSEHRRLVLPSPPAGAPQVLRMRAGDARGPTWSAWSAPVTFGCLEEASASRLLLLAVPGSLLGALALGCFLPRALRASGVFTPGPHVTHKVTEFLRDEHRHGNQQALIHLPSPEEEEHVLEVEEVSRKLSDLDPGDPEGRAWCPP